MEMKDIINKLEIIVDKAKYIQNSIRDSAKQSILRDLFEVFIGDFNKRLLEGLLTEKLDRRDMYIIGKALLDKSEI